MIILFSHFRCTIIYESFLSFYSVEKPNYSYYKTLNAISLGRKIVLHALDEIAIRGKK